MLLQILRKKLKLITVTSIVQFKYECVHMRDEMNSYRFEISSRRENKFCSHKFHFDCISKRPDILMDMCRHFISGSVYMILYHLKWNFISVEVTDRKSIYPHWVSKAHAHKTQHPMSLRLFISFRVNYVHMKILCRFEISFRSIWPIWNPYRFEFHFASIHVNTSKELTEPRNAIFNRDEISYCFEFISPLIWTYCKTTIQKFLTASTDLDLQLKWKFECWHSSSLEVLLGKLDLKTCGKFTREHPEEWFHAGDWFQ